MTSFTAHACLFNISTNDQIKLNFVTAYHYYYYYNFISPKTRNLILALNQTLLVQKPRDSPQVTQMSD